MVDILQHIGNSILAGILAAGAMVNGFTFMLQATISPQEKTASISEVVPVQSAPSPLFAGIPSSLPIASATFPTSTIAVSSTAATAVASLPQATTTAEMKVIAPIPPKPAPPKIAPAPIPMAATQPITAQWFSDNAKLNLKQKPGGGYEAAFSASNGVENFTWGVSDAFVGGTATTPKFAFSLSCGPLLEVPPLDSFDQTPFFKVRTSYDCTMGFAATSGNDRKIYTKDLNIATGPGQLTANPPSAMNTVLADDVNNGGFVLENEDVKPIGVNSLTFDVSYTGLNTQNGPFVLQILDPATDAPLFEYHLENLPTDPSLAYTHAAAGINASLALTLNPADRKLLPIRILGVHRVMMSGTTPKVAITLRALSVTPSDVKLNFSSAQIHWSCEVPTGGYDPNATTGPFAMGNACQ